MDTIEWYSHLRLEFALCMYEQGYLEGELIDLILNRDILVSTPFNPLVLYFHIKEKEE